MEAPMARATKTTRATVGSRRGAAAVVISVTIKPDLLNRARRLVCVTSASGDPLGSDCRGRAAAPRGGEVKRLVNKE
jgi:DNA invertase Pin-like site-specific DNA recombinase